MTIDFKDAQWFKSSKSSAGGDCVEVAHLSGDAVGVRDSKNPARTPLVFTPQQWDTFLFATKNNDFDSVPKE